ncbi:MAG TPA: peptidoglycan-binding protein, partial [Actinomycetota bacterium]|nr:peptidoglycan-binding protein [Actinomycetota bacterium]
MELIRPGERSAAVLDLQSRLEDIGFELEASERGHFGPSTEKAVRALQRDRGLDVDGIVGENTWRELVESSWKLGDRLLQLSRPFSRGDDVAELQIRLNALGFDAGKQDGIFGPRTARALTRFQTDLGIDPDGIAGHETIVALDRLRLVTKRGLGARTREREARRDVSRGMLDKRIVIDPGHGGTDPGSLGPSGESEAELAFRISASLARRLDSVGTL